MGQFAMDLMRMSDSDLLNEFEVKMRFKLGATDTAIKGMYSRQMELIKAEIMRRMKWQWTNCSLCSR